MLSSNHKNLAIDPGGKVDDVQMGDICALRHSVVAELKRQGWKANHKRVGCVLREDNLLCLRKKKFHSTTDAKHGFQVYSHLTRNFVPAARNQLWVADITYIWLAEEFVYLAVVLDAYSRLVIGWALERTLEAKSALGALQLALHKRDASVGLNHHSESRRAVRLWGLHASSEGPWNPDQHQPQSQSLRQREDPKFYEDSTRK